MPVKPSPLLFDTRTARFDATGRYRCLLRRSWAVGSGVCLWIMFNPSVADESRDDPTIRRCMDFARRWGFGAIEVVNLFALVATNPRDLARSDDPIGPENDFQIQDAADHASRIIAAWGALAGKSKRVRERRRDVARLLADKPVHALGLTSRGAPQHPLYVPRVRRPIVFNLARHQ